MKRYKIREFSRRSGIPADTLRYYEKMGLLHSVREEQNAYRTYDDHDLITVSQLRMMRGVDVPLSMLKPDENPHALNSIQQHLLTEKDRLARQVDMLQSKLERVQVLLRELEECRQRVGLCRDLVYPETLNIYLTDKPVDDRLAELIASWQEHQPYVHPICYITAEEFHSGAPTMTARPGLGIHIDYARKFGLSDALPVISKGEHPGVRCLLMLHDPLHPTREEFKPLLDYLGTTNRRIDGGVQYRIRFVDTRDDGTQVCYAAVRINTAPDTK